MKRIPIMDCGDGVIRADNGSMGTPKVVTANYTISATEAGKTFSNRGAAGTVLLTLPPPKDGMKFGLVVETPAQSFGVQTDVVGTKIAGGVAWLQGRSLTHTVSTEYAYLQIFASGGNWYTKEDQGTWALA
jgi:hypothetical protein